MTEQTVADKKAQLESALLDFPDEWDMVEELAEAFVDLVHFRPEPTLRELKPGEEPHSRFEIEGYSSAHVKWSDEHKKLKERYQKIETQIEKYRQAKNELARFGKK